MKISPLPENEEKRLEAILSYHILDTEDEDDFDGIVELASQLCNTPIALITLIDRNRQWFKAKTGLDIKETHRNLSFCAHAIHKNDIMIVADALQDERFFDNPLVTGDPYIRFYCGMPLIANEGIKLGTLAVIDRVPRELTEKQLKDLRILGKQVVNLLNQRCTISLLQKTNQQINRLVEEKTVEIRDVFERVSDAFMAVDKNWSITFINEKAAQITNRSSKDILGKNIWKEFPEAFSSIFPKIAEAAMVTQQYQYQEAYFQPYDRWLESHIYPSPSGLSIYFRDITERKRSDEAIRVSETNYRMLIEGNPQPMWIYDTENLSILEVNEAAIIKYGYSRNEFLKKTILDLRPIEEYDKLTRYLNSNQVAKKGLSQSGPWKHCLKNGDLIDVEITSHEIIWNGRHARFTLAWDVTRRLQVEDSIRHAEERFRNIFENATEGIYQTTPEGRFITANPSMAKMFGYESAVELMTSITDIGNQIYADPQDRVRMREMLETHGQANGHEIRFLKRNKEILWGRINNRAVKDNQGKIKYFEGTLEDITERKQTEEKLWLQKLLDQIITKAQSLFINSEDPRHAFDTLLHDLLFITKSEYGFIGEVLFTSDGKPFLKTHTITNIAWNDETEKYYNDNIQEGLIFANLKTLFGEVMVTGKPVIANNPGTDTRRGGLPKGHPALNAFLGIPFGLEGKIEGMLGLSNRPGGYDEALIDFLEPLVSAISHLIKASKSEKLRMQTEIALRKSENKLRAFFRSTPDGSVLLGKNFEIMAFNAAANELAENTYNRGMHEGELYTDLIFPEVRALITEYIQKALNGETSQGEFSIPNIKTGKNVWWLVSFMPAYDNDGNIFGAVANSTNIHEIKKAQLKLKNQFKELQKTNQELDRFVYSVSHDLRAPLATILGLLNVAEMEKPAPAFKNYLAMIRSSINRLDGFIKDILDYSRNARKEIQIEPINFQELITESQDSLRLLNGADRLRTVIEIENTVAFNSDKLRIGILLNNLFSNSIKYQDHSKESSIISIRVVTSAEKAFIYFSDNGIGIESKHLPKIFDMFYRASENSKGSGLGLYIAKETIAKLEGSIKVESEFGVSTTFEIVIPNSKPKNKA